MTDNKRSTRSILPPWLSGRWGVIAVLSSLYMLVYFGWTQFHWGGDANIKLIGDLINLPIDFVSVLAAWYVIRQKNLEPRLRRMWILLGLACLAYLIADSIWAYLELYLQVSPFPAVSDIFYLLFAPLVVAGLLSMPSTPLSQQERRQFAFDFLITMITTVILMWYFIIQPTAASNAGDLVTQSVAVAYPVMDVVIIGGIVGALLRKPDRNARSVLWLLFLGALFFVGGDVVYGYTSLAGTYVTGGWVDTTYCFALLFFTFAALRQVYRSPADSLDSRFMKILDGFARLLPNIATTFGGIVAIIVVVTNFNARSGWLIAEVILAVVVLLAIIIRQFPNLSVRLKVIMALVGITVVTVAVLAVYLLNQIYQNAYNTAATQITTENSEHVLSIQNFLSEHSQDVMILSQLPDLNNLIVAQQTGADPSVIASDTAGLKQDLQAFFDAHPVYDNVRFIDASGEEVAKVTASYISTTLQNKATRPFFAIPAKMPASSLYLSPLELEQDLGKIIVPNVPVVRFATPVYYNNKLAGVVVANIVAKNFLSTLNDPSHHVMLVDQKGFYLYDNRGTNKLFGGATDLNTGYTIAKDMPAQSTSLLSGKAGSVVDQQNDVYFYAPITVLNGMAPSWYLVYEVPQSEIYSLANRTLATSLLILAAILLVALAIAVYLGNTFTAPLISLTRTAQEAARGNFTIQSNVKSKDEIGVLANTFNQMTSQLGNLVGTLEQRVNERTHDLELASEVGRTITEKVANLNEMLTSAVEMIRSRFNLYYTQVYLMDYSGRTISLRAGTGEIGKQLLQREHRLIVGPGSLNGRAVAEKKPIIVADTTQSVNFLPNPLLPNTRSEMVIPLFAGEKLLGVLDMQSEQIGSLNEDNLPVFETLAGQLAIAIQNATLFAAAEEARSEVEAQVRRLTERGWQEFLDAIERGQKVGYAFDQQSVVPLKANALYESAIENAINVPITVTGEQVGVIQLGDEPDRAWTASETEMVQATARQLAQHIENLRLLAQAERYRIEAEQAARRLTREGWDVYSQSRSEQATGYMFDLNEVQPLTERSNGNSGGSLKYPLIVRDEAVGELTVDSFTHSDGAAEIVAAVTHQLSGHIENLRLTEQNETRAHELETVAEVSATTATLLDPDRLLQTVVDVTKERFGVYHAHVYLADDSWKTLLLAAGAGEVGRKMVAEEHAIALDAEKSLVARAARERQAVIVNDVRDDPTFLPNPLLPEARSEMAIPMIVGDKVLGVFDVQSDRQDGFTREDANIYTTLASQVAVALQNARLYAEQAAAVTQLRELDRLKTSFLANMSHELRTPLNSILGFSDVILEGLDGPVTGQMDNDLRLIGKNGQHLLHLINDVLDMAKIDAGRMNLQPEKFKLNGLFEEAINITSSLAGAKSLSLIVKEDSDRTIEVFADRTRLQQVMINLINNAIKFTERGEVALRARQKDDHVLIEVQDTGIGIPPEQLQTIFQEFTQVDTSTTRKTGGTGLGLPISRRLIELHGGRLWAESTGILGEGSTFYVELPLIAKIAEPAEKKER